MSFQDRNKQLGGLLADMPYQSTNYRSSAAFRGARVRWLLELADVIDALGLADTDKAAAAARTAAFDLVGEAMTTTASPAQAAL